MLELLICLLYATIGLGVGVAEYRESLKPSVFGCSMVGLWWPALVVYSAAAWAWRRVRVWA
jgi:hypothetical protein